MELFIWKIVSCVEGKILYIWLKFLVKMSMRKVAPRCARKTADVFSLRTADFSEIFRSLKNFWARTATAQRFSLKFQSKHCTAAHSSTRTKLVLFFFIFSQTLRQKAATQPKLTTLGSLFWLCCRFKLLLQQINARYSSNMRKKIVL